MPANTPVHRMFKHLVTAGYSEESAAKIAQSKTGKSLVTGRRPQRGQYNGKTDRQGRTKVG